MLHKRRYRAVDTLRIMIVILSILVIILASAAFITEISQYAAGNEFYSELNHAGESTREKLAAVDVDLRKSTHSSAVSIEDEPAIELEQAAAVGMDQEPASEANQETINKPKRKTVSGAGNAVAWIYSENTVIDYPVMQCNDNKYYLTHLPDGRKNNCGAIFMDKDNASDFTDDNTVLYGHHMRSGRMFASLMGYKEQSYYEGHKRLMLYLTEETYLLEVFAGYILNPSMDKIPLNFVDSDSFLRYINEGKSNSTFKSNVEVAETDRIVSLYTCSYEFSDAKYIVQCKLTKMN